jgi:hypothetical protein
MSIKKKSLLQIFINQQNNIAYKLYKKLLKEVKNSKKEIFNKYFSRCKEYGQLSINILY